MITALQVRELLHAKPFKPFRIWTSDGTQYDILNHEAAFVTKNTVEVGLNLDPDGFAGIRRALLNSSHHQARRHS